MPVRASVFREGHDQLAAEVVAIDPTGARRDPVRMVPEGDQPNRYVAHVTPDVEGEWTFEIHSWSDPIATWQHDGGIKIPAGVDVELMFTEARLLLERVAADDLDPASATRVQGAIAAASDAERPVAARLAALQDPELDAVLLAHPIRELTTVTGPFRFRADRTRALFGSWYEFFPRSEGATRDEKTGTITSGTFLTAMERLERVAEMGFDVLYLPPIHPIGALNRKGPNNTLTPGPDDPGSPWAIGSKDGGHDAIHPELGHLRRLRRLRRARRGARPRGRPRPGPPGRPRPPVGDLAPAVLHHPRRRHHRVRREPAEEVPGHLPDQLRQRPQRDLPRGAPDRAAVDLARRQDLPRRQPAHQAPRLLGVADGGGAPDQPGGRVPVRGLHQAGDDARPRRGRLPPELHLLHVAQRQARDRGLPPRGVLGVRPPDAAELLGQHPRHPAELPPVRRSGGVQGARGPGRDRVAELGRLRRLRALRARRDPPRCGGVPRLGEVPDPDPRLEEARRRGHHAGAVPHAAQRDPPPAPGPPAAAQRHDPLERRRPRPGVQQEGPAARRR